MNSVITRFSKCSSSGGMTHADACSPLSPSAPSCSTSMRKRCDGDEDDESDQTSEDAVMEQEGENEEQESENEPPQPVAADDGVEMTPESPQVVPPPSNPRTSTSVPRVLQMLLRPSH